MLIEINNTLTKTYCCLGDHINSINSCKGGKGIATVMTERIQMQNSIYIYNII